MSHVLDDLELYVLDALDDGTRARVGAHLGECAGCAHAARELARIADALPETVPDREPPVRLRARILASARADVRPARRRSFSAARLLRSWVPVTGMALAMSVVILAVGMTAAIQLADARAEAAETREIAMRVGEPARTWTMRPSDQRTSAWAALYAPADAPAFAVVHDLPAAPSGNVYALWLVDADGRWTRATNFSSRGWAMQLVDVDMQVVGYAQCAVTLEARADGKRAGPVLMRSELYQTPIR